MYVVLFDELCEFLFFSVDAIRVKLKNVDVMCSVCVSSCCTGVRWEERRGL